MMLAFLDWQEVASYRVLELNMFAEAALVGFLRIPLACGVYPRRGPACLGDAHARLSPGVGFEQPDIAPARTGGKYHSLGHAKLHLARL